jgi:hypothetical protein
MTGALFWCGIGVAILLWLAYPALVIFLVRWTAADDHPERVSRTPRGS